MYLLDWGKMTHSFLLVTSVIIFNHALQWSVAYDLNAKQTGHLKLLGYRFDKFVQDMKWLSMPDAQPNNQFVNGIKSNIAAKEEELNSPDQTTSNKVTTKPNVSLQKKITQKPK